MRTCAMIENRKFCPEERKALLAITVRPFWQLNYHITCFLESEPPLRFVMSLVVSCLIRPAQIVMGSLYEHYSASSLKRNHLVGHISGKCLVQIGETPDYSTINQLSVDFTLIAALVTPH